MSKEVRHHLEFQSNDNRYAEVQKTADYEEFISRYGEDEEKPSLDQWVAEMAFVYGNASGGPGRARVWIVTREEIDIPLIVKQQA